MSQTHRAIESVAEALDTRIASVQRVGGGDFAAAFQVQLEDERTLFVKTHENPPPFFFSTEAKGLRWLAEAAQGAEQTLRVHEPAGLAVAEVVYVSDEPPVLALTWIDTGPAQAPDEAEFGRALAALHRQDFPCYGRPDARTTGSLAVPNSPTEHWPEFYAEQRLLALAERAREREALPLKTLAELERVAARLGNGSLDIPSPVSPALLHGDLWAGNRLVDTQGQSWLIDPAAQGGHPEFDLAMMRLFGGFGERAYAAYQEINPLEPGWSSRVVLHQLAPLVVHAIKFGGHYVQETAHALASLR